MAVWHCREKEIEYGSKVLLMGIVNVTPDSFSDGVNPRPGARGAGGGYFRHWRSVHAPGAHPGDR